MKKQKVHLVITHGTNTRRPQVLCGCSAKNRELTFQAKHITCKRCKNLGGGFLNEGGHDTVDDLISVTNGDEYCLAYGIPFISRINERWYERFDGVAHNVYKYPMKP